MEKIIKKSVTDLMLEAPKTVLQMYSTIAESLDQKYGSKWSASHPDVVASLVNAAEKDFTCGVLGKILTNIGEALEENQKSIDGISSTVESAVDYVLKATGVIMTDNDD